MGFVEGRLSFEKGPEVKLDVKSAVEWVIGSVCGRSVCLFVRVLLDSVSGDGATAAPDKSVR